jgi:hypothetical protein
MPLRTLVDVRRVGLLARLLALLLLTVGSRRGRLLGRGLLASLGTLSLHGGQHRMRNPKGESRTLAGALPAVEAGALPAVDAGWNGMGKKRHLDGQGETNFGGHGWWWFWLRCLVSTNGNNALYGQLPT